MMMDLSSAGQRLLTAALLLIWFATTAMGEPATIVVDTSKSPGKVNRLVFGNNVLGYQKGGGDFVTARFYERGCGIWDPERRRSVPEYVALAKSAGITVSRWPGGCATHRFDWKKTVGPLSDRGGQLFGLPEFLQNCADIDAEPLITLADYFGTAEDAADLVEYLNAPDDGKHAWAAKRANDGHPAPWQVVWFEYGNESEHGDHRGQQMSAGEYAHKFLDYQRAMKAVDPRIKLGAVIATGFPKLEKWARPVLKICGSQADFVIHHSYIPRYSDNSEDGKPDAKTLFRAGLAVADQIQAYYDEMNALIWDVTERSDVPVAVTEFNGSFAQERPVPYRHCLGNALINAEMLSVFLRPRNHVLMANFWHFSNDYWGQVKGYVHTGESPVKRPQYSPFELYHNHFGTDLLEARVECDTYETGGGWGVAPASGRGRRFQLVGTPIDLKETWKIVDCRGVVQRIEGSDLVAEFSSDAGDVNYCHGYKSMPAEPETSYRLTAWIKTEGLTSGKGACFQITDARGIVATRSCSLTHDVKGSTAWTKVVADYTTLADTNELCVTARRISGAGPVSGRALFRAPQLQKFIPAQYGAVPVLSATASRSSDGGKIFLMIVNKNLDTPVQAVVSLTRFSPQRARAWLLTGPAVDATNERDPVCVSVRELDLGAVRNNFSVEFPRHSLTAIEVE